VKQVMDEEQKHYLRLSIILLAISALLFIKYIPNILFNPTSGRLLNDLFDVLVPILGICTVYEFLRKDRDTWGWGGILFHIVMIIWLINFTFLSVQSILSFSFEVSFILAFLFNLTICILSWFGFLLYYD